MYVLGINAKNPPTCIFLAKMLANFYQVLVCCRRFGVKSEGVCPKERNELRPLRGASAAAPPDMTSRRHFVTRGKTAGVGARVTISGIVQSVLCVWYYGTCTWLRSRKPNGKKMAKEGGIKSYWEKSHTLPRFLCVAMKGSFSPRRMLYRQSDLIGERPNEKTVLSD